MKYRWGQAAGHQGHIPSSIQGQGVRCQAVLALLQVALVEVVREVRRVLKLGDLTWCEVVGVGGEEREAGGLVSGGGI